MDPDPTSNLSNTNRTIYDSDDENWAEIRLKSLHDPLNLINQSNKDVPKSSKPKVAKTPQKRRRKAVPIISRPALPRYHSLLEGDIIIQGILAYNSMKYVIKKVPTHAIRFGVPFNTNFWRSSKSIGDDMTDIKYILSIHKAHGSLFQSLVI
ncbi:hypothetical protein H5410_006438 [Solanum commersonii]|uniref:Uncharacterized protein n=1 Tax=Solanum commersonii TaxID=4109 RepID=A0A9J6AA91_SOLCO|nr:hypothetical protein H5410_006438 [Solanum commersonii]